MKIKAIIFDMNGVFVKDSGPLSTRIENDFGVDAEEIHSLIKESLKRVRVPGTNSRPAWLPILEKLNMSYEEFFKYWFSGESLNSELLQFTKELKKNGILIIILSNNFPERTNNYRELFPELFAIVDEQYFSWETGNIKPSKDAFTQIIDKHSFLPEEYLLVDDKDENLVSASNLGIAVHKYQSIDDLKSYLNKP